MNQIVVGGVTILLLVFFSRYWDLKNVVNEKSKEPLVTISKKEHQQ